MQYEQTIAHMKDSSNHSSISFKCHPEHTHAVKRVREIISIVVFAVCTMAGIYKLITYGAEVADLSTALTACKYMHAAPGA